MLLRNRFWFLIFVQELTKFRIMKKLLDGVQYFFEEIAFAPMNVLRNLELENWWAASVFNWLFMFIGMSAFVYWMLQLKKHNDNNEEKRYVVSHSFLAEDKQ